MVICLEHDKIFEKIGWMRIEGFDVVGESRSRELITCCTSTRYLTVLFQKEALQQLLDPSYANNLRHTFIEFKPDSTDERKHFNTTIAASFLVLFDTTKIERIKFNFQNWEELIDEDVYNGQVPHGLEEWLQESLRAKGRSVIVAFDRNDHRTARIRICSLRYLTGSMKE